MSYRSFSADRLIALANTLPTVAVGVADFKVLTPTVARVIVTPTDRRASPQELARAVTTAFGGKCQPVLASFRELPGARTHSMVGYVTTNREVMDATDPRYSRLRQVTASSMLDPQDDVLWDIRASEDGKPQLVRALEEDLSVLLAKVQTRDVSAPRLLQVASPAAAHEFVAFVDTKVGEVRYGFVLASSEDDTYTVIATDAEQAEKVHADAIVEVAVTKEQTKQVAADVSLDDSNFDSASASSMEAFYKALYGYAPGYVQDIVSQINMHAAT